MKIDPLLAGLVGRVIEQLGDTAQQARTGRFAAPISEWQNRDVLDFIDTLRQITGDDYMRLAAAPCAVGTATFLIELGTRCSTLREAMEMGFRLMAIATTAFQFELHEEGRQAEIAIHQVPGPGGASSALSTWITIAWHKLLQWLIDAEIPLEKVEFQHELDSPYTDYSSMFCGNCVFNGTANRLVFAQSFLDRRIVRLPHEGDRLRATTPGYFAAPGLIARSWNQLVRNMLRRQLAEGDALATVEELAQELGISGQTLRRRLRAEGASYRQLKAEARLETARHLVVDLNAGLGAASIGAGYSEPNALTRALKTGRGLSGQALRSQVLGGSKTD